MAVMNVKPPTVSVVVPCYKQAHFLPESLGSVQAQTFPDWECIIVNDGSPDNTAEAAREWLAKDRRFRYVEKPNGGLSSARNAGLEAVRGCYVHFLDADDYIAPTMYERVLAVFQARPEAAAVYCGCQCVDVAGVFESNWAAIQEHDDTFHELLKGNRWPCHCIVARRDLVADAGGFDITLKSCEDWDLWLRIAARNSSFARCNEALAFYRKYNGSMSTNHWRMFEAGATVIRQNATLDQRCMECRRLRDAGVRQAWNSFMYPQLVRNLRKGAILQWAKDFLCCALNHPSCVLWWCANVNRFVWRSIVRGERSNELV